MTRHIKSITVKVKKSKSEIIFRILVTILEVIPGVILALATDFGTAETIALASAIGAIISAVVNVIRESGLLELLGGETNGA